jgi:rubredoxin
MKPVQPKKTLHGLTAEGEAPRYWECPVCGFLSADPAFGGGEKRCPFCDAPPDARRQWPPERLRKLDARIREYRAQGEDEIVVILVATLLETLLEDILDRIMRVRGADSSIRAAVLDGQRAVGQRIGRLFPKLTGEEFEDAAAELGFRDFPHRWRTMRAVRNAFIHDDPYEGVQEQMTPQSSAEAMELLDQAYKLFVSINNRFVASAEGAGRTADHS